MRISEAQCRLTCVRGDSPRSILPLPATAGWGRPRLINRAAAPLLSSKYRIDIDLLHGLRRPGCRASLPCRRIRTEPVLQPCRHPGSEINVL